MKHFKKGAKVALLGENYFPPLNDSHTTLRRGEALHRVMGAILKQEPAVIYLCPTKGVNINILPLILLNRIPFRLVIPSKHFFSTLSADDKGILDLASAAADKIIILDDTKCDPLRWVEDWYQASKKVVDNSDLVIIAHNSGEVTEAFDELVYKFKDNPTPVLAVGFDVGE